MLNRRTARIVGGLSLVVFGIAVGILADRIFLTRHSPAAIAVVSGEDAHTLALQHLQELFALDDEQVRQIDEVFRRHQGTIIASWTTLQPQLSAAIESVHVSMAAILRPEQREAFRTWIEEQGTGATILDHQPRHERRHSSPP